MSMNEITLIIEMAKLLQEREANKVDVGFSFRWDKKRCIKEVANLTKIRFDQDHVIYHWEKQERTKLAESKKTFCTVCGEEMVARKNSRTGAVFMGCAAFPKCRAPKPIYSGYEDNYDSYFDELDDIW